MFKNFTLRSHLALYPSEIFHWTIALARRKTMFEPSSPMYAIANYFFTRKLKTRATVSPEGRFSFFVASTDTARLVSQS